VVENAVFDQELTKRRPTTMNPSCLLAEHTPNVQVVVNWRDSHKKKLVLQCLQLRHTRTPESIGSCPLITGRPSGEVNAWYTGPLTLLSRKERP